MPGRYPIGGGGTAAAALEMLATAGTLFDPSAIGVSQAASGGGSNITATIDTPATVSNLPHLVYGKHYALSDIFGAAEDYDGIDLCRPQLIVDAPPVDIDLCILLVVYNDSVTPGGAPQSASKGFGCKLAYSGGNWNCRSLRSAGSWVERSATNTNVNTEGATATTLVRASQTGHVVAAQPTDGSGIAIGGTNEVTVDDISNIGDGHNRAAWGLGWDTGVGGPASSALELHAAVALLRCLGVPGFI